MIEWAWSIGGMILTGKTDVLGDKLVILSLCPPQFSREQLCVYLNIQSVPRSKHSLSPL